jgi:DNA-binding beta-propeller fold protein YncE
MHFEIETFAGTDDFVGSSADIEANPGDGPVAEARLFLANQIAITPSGTVYVTETFFNGIRKIENGIVSTLTSRTEGSVDGPLSQALFRGPTGIVSGGGGNLYIADQLNHRIRKIDTAGNVTTVAGPSGPERTAGWVDAGFNQALFSLPRAIAFDEPDKSLYVSEHDRIRNIPVDSFQPGLLHTRTSNDVRTVAAVGLKGFADGPPLLAQFDLPLGLAVDRQTGDLFVADTNNRRIRRVSHSAGTVTTVAGDGRAPAPTDAAQFADGQPALEARFERPRGIAVDKRTGIMFVTDVKHLRMYDPRSNLVFTACSDPEHRKPIEFATGASGIALLEDEGKIFVVDHGRVMLLTPILD